MLESFLKGKDIPKVVTDNLELISVKHYDFEGNIANGFIVCNKSIANDLVNIFNELLIIKFPINSIIPISEFKWDDMESVKENNTSCFNYRNVIGSKSISDHATGNAIDINPFQNPWVHPLAHKIDGRKYDQKQIGTITTQVIQIFKKYNFNWGGDWKNPDYQHFFKPDMDLKLQLLKSQ